MELEQLKQEWQLLNDKVEQIELRNRLLTQEIIDHKLKSQFDALLSYERKSFISLLILLPLFFILQYFFSNMTMVTDIWMDVLIVSITLWQGYMYRQLTQIQNKEQSIITLTTKMQRYQVLFKLRLLVGIVWAIIFIVMLSVFESSHIKMVAILGGVGGLIGISSLMKQIRNLSTYVKTLQELKEDNY